MNANDRALIKKCREAMLRTEGEKVMREWQEKQENRVFTGPVDDGGRVMIFSGR